MCQVQSGSVGAAMTLGSLLLIPSGVGCVLVGDMRSSHFTSTWGGPPSCAICMSLFLHWSISLVKNAFSQPSSLEATLSFFLHLEFQAEVAKLHCQRDCIQSQRGDIPVGVPMTAFAGRSS